MNVRRLGNLNPRQLHLHDSVRIVDKSMGIFPLHWSEKKEKKGSAQVRKEIYTRTLFHGKVSFYNTTGDVSRYFSSYSSFKKAAFIWFYIWSETVFG